MNNRVLLLSAAFMIGGAALMFAPAARPAIVRPTGINEDRDEYGEPEPELTTNWIDWPIWSGGDMQASIQQSAAGLLYFQPEEFGEWWQMMSADLLQKLDTFRSLWGKPVMISPASGALGRHAGTSGSYHNVDRWGVVRAVDVFPSGLTMSNARRAVEMAETAGFGGIGLYTDTQPSMMMHLDNRETTGRWARVDGQYTGISNAYA